MRIKFNVNVNVKRRYLVDGKEYASIEGMPAEVREAYRKVLPASPPVHLSESPVEPRPASSPFLLWTIVGLVFLTAVRGVYYPITLRGAR